MGAKIATCFVGNRGCWVEALKEAGLEVTVRSVPEQLQNKFEIFRIPEDLETINTQMTEERQHLDDLQHLDESVVERYANYLISFG